MKVPLFELNRQYQRIKLEIDKAFKNVLESGIFILGNEVEVFERNVARYLGVKHSIGVANGTDALLLALRASGVGPGDKVIVPSFTFFATAGVVHNIGAVPIFADIDPRTFNIDPTHIARLLKSDPRLAEKTKAMIPVHLYGQMAEMDPIMDLAEKFDLVVIEDAAQAIGAEYEGHKAGTIGRLGCFSFYPTKNLGAYGDGGLVVSDDDELSDRIRMLRVHGAKHEYCHDVVGMNSRLDELQAAVLQAKLTHLDEWNRRRQDHASYYSNHLSEIKGITVPYVARNQKHIYHQYTIRVANGRRDALKNFMGERGIGTRIYYPFPLHLQPCFSHLGYKKGDLTESENASSEVLSLPLFPELAMDERDSVLQTIFDFTKSSETNMERGKHLR